MSEGPKMTRGRQPLLALEEAYKIARRRGPVMESAPEPDDRFHFILFMEGRTVFIKIQRTRAQTSDPAGVLQEYHRGIRQLSKVPLTPVCAREFWVRSPRGTWQYFMIENMTAKELGTDGSVLSGMDGHFPPKEPARSAGYPPAEPVSGQAVPGD